MSSVLRDEIQIPASRRGEPAWALATMYPLQGSWTEDDFYRIESAHFMELVDGCVEFLPMPTWLHQRIIRLLLRRFELWTERRGLHEVLFAPLPLRLFPGTIREPDLLIVERPAAGQPVDRYPKSALLVVEVVSDGDEARKRDLIEKRLDYAKAGIAEYWIVDPVEQRVLVLSLRGDEYEVAGDYQPGETARSVVLADFHLNTAELWALETGG